MSTTDAMPPPAELTEFCERLQASLSAGTFLKLALGKYRGGGAEQRCTVTPVALSSGPHVKLVTRRGTQETTENVAVDRAAVQLGTLIGSGYLSATLFTTESDVSLVYNRKRVPRLARTKPTLAEAPAAEHNRTKDYLVDPAAPFLAHLGVTHVPAPGKPAQVKPSMYAKFRQINRFVEILDQLLAASTLAGAAAPRIVDIGAGKGYLTFAMHEHLRRLGRAPVTCGIEANAGLVERCETVARACATAGLSFEAAKAQTIPAEGIDILIALHACDTATDDALYLGIKAGAGIIVCAPCCQHEIAQQLEPAGSPIEGLLKFGLLRQRQADLVTDAVRALLLQAAGYEVRIIEFVTTEHTAKNLLISGVRSERADRRAARTQLERLQALAGFQNHRLQTLLTNVSE